MEMDIKVTITILYRLMSTYTTTCMMSMAFLPQLFKCTLEMQLEGRKVDTLLSSDKDHEHGGRNA